MKKHKLKDPLYSVDQVRELDRIAIEEYGIPGLVLMRRAAEACYQILTGEWPKLKKICVFCGSGNNAGDGYILGGLLADRGFDVEVVQVGNPEKLGPDALEAYEYCKTTNATLFKFEPAIKFKAELVVDALLGTGLKGAVRPLYADAIELINLSGLPVLSIDIPSGLCADTGSISSKCIQSSVTVTFIALKRGLFTGAGPSMCGKTRLSTLELPFQPFEKLKPAVSLLDIDELQSHLQPRPKNAHKGYFGHLLVVGGDESMPGAVAMASEAALRMGAGLVTVATRRQHINAIVARRPEVMVVGIENASQLRPLLATVTCILAGPGLGKSDWSRELMSCVLQSSLPMVVDADGLNLLAESEPESRANWILTPHPGEAARLLNTTNSTIQSDRFQAVTELQSKYGGVTLLKGAGTLVLADRSLVDKSSDQAISLCAYGNPGMATAGMGDVLSGVIGSLLAQGFDAKFATELGACLHSKAADICAQKKGEKGMLATDLMPFLRKLMNP